MAWQEGRRYTKGQSGKISLSFRTSLNLQISIPAPHHIPKKLLAFSINTIIMPEQPKNGAICWVLIPATDVIRGVYLLLALQELDQRY